MRLHSPSLHGLLLLQSFQRTTYCVNFHVVGLPSAASTMIPETKAVNSVESDQDLVQSQVQQRRQLV